MRPRPRASSLRGSSRRWLPTTARDASDFGANALEEVVLEDAVDPDGVAKERIGLDAVIVHVVEPVDRRLDDRLVLAFGIANVEALAGTWLERDRLRDR